MKAVVLYAIIVIVALLLCLTGCKMNTSEIDDPAGYIPVKVCVEKVSYSIVMKKGVVRIEVSYWDLSHVKCKATIDLGRNPKGLFHKGDTLTMYLHPDRPDELKYVKCELRPNGKIKMKKR